MHPLKDCIGLWVSFLLLLASKLFSQFHNSVLTNFHINNNTCLNEYSNKFISPAMEGSSPIPPEEELPKDEVVFHE